MQIHQMKHRNETEPRKELQKTPFPHIVRRAAVVAAKVPRALPTLVEQPNRRDERIDVGEHVLRSLKVQRHLLRKLLQALQHLVAKVHACCAAS